MKINEIIEENSKIGLIYRKIEDYRICGSPGFFQDESFKRRFKRILISRVNGQLKEKPSIQEKASRTKLTYWNEPPSSFSIAQSGEIEK